MKFCLGMQYCKMELIPGLPYDIGLQCLFRVPLDQFQTITSVYNNRKWKQQFSFPEFWNLRKAAGFSQPVVVMVQALVQNSVKLFRSPTYRVTLCNLSTGIWTELPRVPWFPVGLPLFCHVVAIGLNLVVIGGQDPMTGLVSREVSVYNFLAGKWTRGTRMPGCQRSFFACAASDVVNGTWVFVAGGLDEDNKALRSALAYDVASDLWVSLPDMWTRRAECKGVFHGGKFHVIGGYDTEMQGRFGKSADVYDAAALKWEPVVNEYLVAGNCPRTCFSGGDGKLYMCLDDDVAYARTDDDVFNWRGLTQLPGEEIGKTVQITGRQNKVFVIGSSGCGGSHNAYVFDLETHKWIKVEAPTEFMGHVQSCCWLNI